MGLFDRFFGGGREQRAAQVASSREDFWAAFGLDMHNSATGVVVNIENAMRVPAVSCAVNFIAETVATLPRDYYRKGRDGSRNEGTGSLVALLKDAATDELTAYEWTKGLLVAKLTGGRAFSYIERDSSGRPINFWPMDPTATTVKRDGFAKWYEYRDGSRTQRYEATEVIDLPFMLKSDGIAHRSPIVMGRDVIGLAIAATEYGAKFFHGGGVPPFVIEGQFQTPAGMQRAADDLAAAVKKAKSENRLALALPANHKITPLGATPDKSQMVELKRFLIEEIARIYQLPPVFLHDLTHGTYSNTEQQDLQLVKHTLMHHVRQIEQEFNLKLFGRANRRDYVEFNVDAIQRGDFKARMEGWARAVQTGIVKPNEARRAENLPDADGGDKLYIQGATVPLTDTANPTNPSDPNANGNQA